MKISKKQLHEIINLEIDGSFGGNSFPWYLSESSFNRILGKKYMDAGFIILTADRTCEKRKKRPCTPEEEIENEKKNVMLGKTLRRSISQAGFSFVPVFGGYLEENPVYMSGLDQGQSPEELEAQGIKPKVNMKKEEYSYLIPSFNREGYMTPERWQELYKFGLYNCKLYKQESILVKPPKVNQAFYLKQDGSKDTEFNAMTVGDITQQYYTRMMQKKKENRFTFSRKEWGGEKPLTGLDEKITLALMSPPYSVNEASKRIIEGEIMIPIKEVLAEMKINPINHKKEKI